MHTTTNHQFASIEDAREFMNFTREEIQDLEDAIYFALELVALRQELGTWSNPERLIKFTTRLMLLKHKLGSPALVAGSN